eukprot:747261_1
MDAVPTKTVWDVNNQKPTSETEIIPKKPQNLIVQTEKCTTNSSKSDVNHPSMEFTPVSGSSQMGATREESKLIASSAGSAMNVMLQELPVIAAVEESPMNAASVETPMCAPEFNMESPMCGASEESPIDTATVEVASMHTSIPMQDDEEMKQRVASLTALQIGPPPELLHLSPATSDVAVGVNVSAMPLATAIKSEPVVSVKSPINTSTVGASAMNQSMQLQGEEEINQQVDSLTAIPIGPPPELLHLSTAIPDVADAVNVSSMPTATTIKSEPVSEEVREATSTSMDLRSYLQSSLVKHEYITTPQPPGVGFKCDYCELEFNTESSWICHVIQYHDNLSRTVKPEPPVRDGRSQYKCEMCPKVFSVKSTLTAHMHTHSGDKPFSCEICQKGFKLKRYLTLHMLIHSSDKPFSCHMCQKAFKRKYDLTVHMYVHSGKKLCRCHICQKAFTQNGSLHHHLRTVHTTAKQFNCDICQKSFNQKGSLKTHMRIHSGIKPHRCDVCQKAFTQKGTLICHMRTHTGEKPFKCHFSFCQMAFSQKSSMKKHVRTHPESRR